MPPKPGSPRRSPGEGSIWKVAEGRFRGVVMVGGVRRSFSGPTRADVAAQIRRYVAQVEEGTAPPSRREQRTVAHQLRAWLATRSGAGLAPATLANHERNAEVHLLPLLGGVLLHQLTAGQIEAAYATLQGPPGHYSPKYLRDIHSTLRQALALAVRDRFVRHNVATDVRLPHAVRPEQRVLTPAEVAAFWRVAEGDRLYALWRLATVLPSRSGELRALLWRDFDPAAGTLVVRRSVRASGDGGRRLETKGPKTRAGIRLVDLDAELVAVLEAHRVRQAVERERAGPQWAEHGLMFTSKLGTPLIGGNLRKAFRRLLRLAGLPDAAAVNVHDLRHTAVSAMLAAGVPLPEVSAVAGHANTQVTAQVYAHALKRIGRTATGQATDFYLREAGEK